MLRLVAILEMVWAIGMFALMGLPTSPWYKVDSIWPYFTYILLATAIGAFCNFRLGWYLTVGINVLVLVLVGGVVSLNMAMFVFGHELYRDSPGTILVVFIYAAIFIAPSAFICGMIYADRLALKKVLGFATPCDDESH
jgi:hypothetical protein